MAHTKSALKRKRTSDENRERNRSNKSKIKTLRRKFMDLIEKKDQPGAATAFSSLCSALDKAVKYNVLTKNTAVRSKTRAAAQLRKIAA